VESYRTEEEQVEALKRWWKENGRATAIGIVLALGLGFGWQAWQKNQQINAENASILFQQMLTALTAEAEQGPEPARALAERIKDEHRGSAYARFAALHLARIAVTEGDLAGAEEELRWVLAMTSEGDDLQRIARLRLARVLAAAGDTEEALGLLESPDPAYAASYAMARGDILLAEDRPAEALAAFERAAAALDTEQPLPRTLSDKIDFLRALTDPAAGEAG
jgi:predicted negative regulator of RcsB-dependent stress response